MQQEVLSVGIDIGTSTTQVIFSKIYVQNTASSWSVPVVKIIDKKIIYMSKIYITPLKDRTTIHIEQLREIIYTIYKDANIEPHQVETGAVIITGETARKDNAAYVLELLSGMAGEFVVATAGPDLEGILAGKGAGAHSYSKEHSCSVMNLDIGGGTTNVALYQNGQVLDTACFDIGGRVIKVDKERRITYISEKLKRLADFCEVTIKEGDKACGKTLCRLTDVMAKVILDVINGELTGEAHDLLVTNHSLSKRQSIDYVSLSGGVAECTRETEVTYPYGDIGMLLGRSIIRALEGTHIRLVKSKQKIRATVIGAGVHTTEISGSTIYYDDALLPIKDVPIIRLSKEQEAYKGDRRSAAIASQVKWYFTDEDICCVALSIRGSKKHSFDQIQSLAEDIYVGVQEVVEKGYPIIVLVDNDNAKILGLSLKMKFNHAVICLDSVMVKDGDYIDIGKPIADGQVVPVIVKTLLI